MDATEALRAERQAELNEAALDRERAEAAHGQVWDTTELQREYTVIGFLAPYVFVERKVDGVRGTLEFQHCPRFYFNFVADERS